MDLLHLEITSLALLAASAFFFVLARYVENDQNANEAKVTTLFFAAISIGLALPLGVLDLRDLLLFAGLTCWGVATAKRSHFDTVIFSAFISAVVMALWVYYYDLALYQYIVGSALAFIDAALLVLAISVWREPGEPNPATRTSLATL